MSIRVETVGNGPDLVLIHGWGMNAHVWGFFGLQLARRYRLHRVSLPGHGGSEFNPAEAGLDAWSDRILGAVPAGATWLGWSLGGLVAMNAALRQPGNIRGLLLLASNPRFVRDQDWRSGVARDVFGDFKQMLLEDSHRTLMRFLALQVARDEHSRELLAQLREQMASVPEPDLAALEAGLAILRETDLRARLPDLQCPRLWLLGHRDTLVPRQLRDALQQIDPVSVVKLIPGAGHAPMLSHTEMCMQYVEEFLCR